MLGSFFRKSNPEQHFELNLPHVDKDKHSEVAHQHLQTDKDEKIVAVPPNKPLFSAQNIALLSILFMLLAAGAGIWSWMKMGKLEKIRQVETIHHEVVLDSLQQVKVNLEEHLNSLETSFSELRTENDTLAMRLANSTNIISEKETVIREIKTQNIREETALRTQVQRLQSTVDRYETVIAVLNQKNASLTAENARLRGTADSLTVQISDLGQKLESQIKKTISEQYKASSFRVEMERRNDRLTVKARRTRELNISFELNNVPAPYQGNQKLFLVITNDQGVPIKTKNPVQTTIKSEKGDVSIIAQAVQSQNVVDNQRIALNYKLEDKLKLGTYIVSVYSEKGLLGVASFRLT